MAASSAPPKAPPHHCQGPSASPWVLGILLLTLVFLPSTSSNTCGEPPRFQSMRATGSLKSSYNVGERVEYECRLGYSHRRPLPKFITCQENQQWSQISNDTCYKKSCPRQPEPLNSQVNVVNGSYEYGNQIEYVCNEGYHLIGERILYCQVSDTGMQWSGSPPRCERIMCTPPPNIPNGAHSGFGKEVFEYQAAVTYTCNRASGPDEFSLIGESQLYCVGPGKWSSDPPQCKVVKCPFPALTNGKQVSGFGTKFYYKANIMFACNQGFYLQGSAIVTCAENGTWQPPIPSCLQGQPPSNTKAPTASSSAPKPPNVNPAVTPGKNSRPSAAPKPPNVASSASQPPNLTPSASQPPNVTPAAPQPPKVTPAAPQPPNLAPSVSRPPKSRPSVSMPSGPAPSSARPRISSIFQYTSLSEGPFDLRDILGWIVVLITTVPGLL